jgi:hypothetical protein
MTFQEYCDVLESEIRASYEEGVSLEDAEKLSAKFLEGMLKVSKELKLASLDSKMRKAGLKAIKAAIYLEEVKKADKKPSDTMLGALVDSHDMVSGEERRLYEAEELRDELDRYFSTFKEAHVYYRGLSKGRFE